MGMVEPFLVPGDSTIFDMGDFMSRDFSLDNDSVVRSTCTHWLPILTFCPVNNLPDLIYVEIESRVSVDLYEVRRRVRKLLSRKKMYMEECAQLIYSEFLDDMPDCKVTVRLMFNKHKVTVV